MQRLENSFELFFLGKKNDGQSKTEQSVIPCEQKEVLLNERELSCQQCVKHLTYNSITQWLSVKKKKYWQ